MSEWRFKNIFDYWDAQKDAIHRHSRKLAKMDSEQRSLALSIMKNHISACASELPEKRLVACAWVMVEDLYKSANRKWEALTEALWDYLEATAGTFCKILAARGFVVHYLVDNTFDQTISGMFKPLELYDRWFWFAGFIYVCPQKIAMEMVEMLGYGKNEYFDILPECIGQAREIASNIIDRCRKEKRHYVFLDTDWVEESFKVSGFAERDPRVITIFRNEPPLPHTRTTISCFDDSGDSLVEHLRQGN